MKVVFADIDNTLLDFDEYCRRTLETGFRELGICEYESWMYDVFEKVNGGLWRQIEEQTITFEELQKVRFNRVFEALGVEGDGPAFEAYFRKALNESAIPVDGAYELLEALQEKYVLAVASNGPFFQQEHRLSIADMKKYFRYIFVSEKAGASKPSGEFFDYVFANMEENVTPEECMIIGDSLTSDIAGGRSFGMKTCYYRRNPKTDAEGKADYVYDDLKELASAVREGKFD